MTEPRSSKKIEAKDDKTQYPKRTFIDYMNRALIGTTVDAGLFRQVKKIAERSDISMHDLLDEGMREIIKKHGSCLLDD